ncbi:MAG: ATP-binding protein, partial [Caryophanon sp.]|nr:ATP-binding protein [Caryophanon sp.]
NNGLMNAIVDRNETAYILTTSGEAIVQINNAAPVYPRMNAAFIEADNAYIFNTPVQIGLFQGVLQVIHPLDAFTELMRYIFVAMLIAGFAALLLSALVGYQLANYFMRPIEALSQEMKRVKEHGFTERTHVSYATNDEIGTLLNVYDAMMEQLEKSFEQQKRFVSDASHELRTPIQALEGHLSLIQRWGKHDEAVLEESIETSLTETRRMKRMIEELLQLARRERLDGGHANVYDVVEAVALQMQYVAPQLTLHNQAKQDVQVNVPDSVLHHIIKNIVENAVKYSDEQPIVYVRTIINERCRIEIEDNGQGMDAQHLPHVFDRFYRIDAARTRQTDGTGLGLAIVKALVESYNGDVFVKSVIGVGTVFIVEFDLFHVEKTLN